MGWIWADENGRPEHDLHLKLTTWNRENSEESLNWDPRKCNRTWILNVPRDLARESSNAKIFTRLGREKLYASESTDWYGAEAIRKSKKIRLNRRELSTQAYLDSRVPEYTRVPNEFQSIWLTYKVIEIFRHNGIWRRSSRVAQSCEK